MKTLTVVFVCALIFSRTSYPQPVRRSPGMRDDLGMRGVIPDAPVDAVQRPVAGTVSLSQLQHKVPAEALREARSARKACDRHDLRKCADHLKKAVEIDPVYLAAHADLGRVYAHLNQPEDTISAYEAVLEIDSHSADAYSFIGAARVSLGNMRTRKPRRAQHFGSTPATNAGASSSA